MSSIHIRPELWWFVKKMESRMSEKDTEKSGWKKEHIDYFLHKIDDASCLLPSKIIESSGVLEKAADIANYAMMAAYVWLEGLSVHERGQAEKNFSERTKSGSPEQDKQDDLEEADLVIARLKKLEDAVREYLKYCGPCEGYCEGSNYCQWEKCPYCNMAKTLNEDV